MRLGRWGGWVLCRSGALAASYWGGLWWAIWLERWRWWGVPLVLIGLTAPLTAHPPDAIIARDLMAVSDRQGGYWMAGRGGFVRERWLGETAADERPWPLGWATGGAGVTFGCDGQACRLTTPDGTLALVEDPDAAADCVSATYGISRYKVPTCDWWAGWDETLLLYLRDGQVERVSSRRPVRPWIAP